MLVFAYLKIRATVAALLLCRETLPTLVRVVSYEFKEAPAAAMNDLNHLKLFLDRVKIFSIMRRK